MQSKNLAELDDEKAQQALKKLETAKTSSELLELVFDAAELGAQTMIKFDKKRVFGRIMGTPIYYPGKISEQLILGKFKFEFYSFKSNLLAMQDKLSKEQFELLMNAQYDLVKMIAKEEVDIEKHISNIKELVKSLY